MDEVLDAMHRMAIQRAIGELESAKETVQGLHRDAADMKLRKIDEAIEFIKGWLL